MSEDCPHCVSEKTEANCRGCFEGSHYKPKPITNADRIRSMSDEELANSKILCPYTAYDMDMCEKWITSGDTRDCAACALDWLRQEASDG